MVSTSEPVGIVQIGAGSAGTIHLKTVLSNPRCRLLAVADVSPAAREAVAQYGVPTYADHRTMLGRHAAEAGAAIVVLPHHMYPDVIADVAKAGLHILKEKPFARSLADAQRMAEALHRADRVYMTAGQRLFDPAYREALRLVEAGALGDIYLAQGQILYAWHPDGLNWGWRGRREFSGGTAILDAGWHILGALYAAKGPPARVYAATGRMRACPAGDYDVDDKGVLTLEYPDGAIASVVTCHVALPGRFEMLLHGWRGNLDFQMGRLVRFDRTGQGEEQEWPAPVGHELHVAQLDYFLECIVSGRTPRGGLHESLDIQRIVEAAYRSTSERRPVQLDEL